MTSNAQKCPISNLSDNEIVKLCYDVSDPNRHIYDQLKDYMVVRIILKTGLKLAVKIGLSITIDEFHNQRRAHELIDQKIVKVPEAYRFFTHEGFGNHTTEGLKGFLVMEYSKGEEEHCLSEVQIAQLSSILKYFATVNSATPGSPGGGTPNGPLWKLFGGVFQRFQSALQMEHWLDSRFSASLHERLQLQEFPLVLCHMDLAPRNILWMSDRSVCFLDWESAGFYPRFFEVLVFEIGTEQTFSVEWEKAVVEQMGLARVELDQLLLLKRL